jgi:hypothetical protein
MTGAHGEDEAKEGMATLIAEQYWRPVADCRSADPDLFFPVSSSGKALDQVAQGGSARGDLPSAGGYGS